jgi:hypothetical protein
MFTVLTAIAILLAILILGWATWFLFEFIRYVLSGEYEIDQRLRKIVR